MTKNQHTLAHAVSCSGIGVHSGAPAMLTLRPAPENTGILFVRTDVSGADAVIPARYDMVTETTLGTTLTNEAGVKAATVEHLMAALWGCGVDNAMVLLDGPEVPIMDGSSEPFVFLIECAGLVEQFAERRSIEITRPVSVREGESFAMIEPSEHFSLDVTIHFDHALIGTQHGFYDFQHVSFKQALCRARTFGFRRDVEKLRAMGLARGGSLDNAIVMDEQAVLNPEGLRSPDEYVRHKALDCLGDYYLAGGFIKGAVTTNRPGHRINNLLMHALMEEIGATRLPAYSAMAMHNDAYRALRA